MMDHLEIDHPRPALGFVKKKVREVRVAVRPRAFEFRGLQPVGAPHFRRRRIEHFLEESPLLEMPGEAASGILSVHTARGSSANARNLSP